MANYISDHAFVAKGTSIPVSEIRTVALKKRLWWWVILALQALVAARFFLIVASLVDAAPGDGRTVLVGQLLGNIIVLATLLLFDSHFGTQLVVGTATRNLKVRMNRKAAREARLQIDQAMNALSEHEHSR